MASERAVAQAVRQGAAHGGYGARRRSGDLERGREIAIRVVFGRDAVA